MSDNNESSESKLKSNLTIILSVMTALVPVLYLMGYYYHQGYLSEFGVLNEFFPRSIQDYLVHSFTVFFQIIIGLYQNIDKIYNSMLWYTGGAFILSLIIAYIEKNDIRDKIKKHKTVTKIVKGDVFYYAFISLLTAFVTFISPFILMVLLGVFIVVPVIAYTQGVTDASNIIKTFEHCDIEKPPVDKKCIFVTKGGKHILDGMLVAKSSTHIAVWNGETTKIYPLKDEQVEIKFVKVKKVDKAKPEDKVKKE